MRVANRNGKHTSADVRPRQSQEIVFLSRRRPRSCTMTETAKRFTGGCLCGGLRYEAVGEPLNAGHCYCSDCRKASGSGFIPFMGFAAHQVRFQGESKMFVSEAANGGVAHRNFCPHCSGLVFGGVAGESDSFTIYCGSLDDPSLFQ